MCSVVCCCACCCVLWRAPRPATPLALLARARPGCVLVGLGGARLDWRVREGTRGSTPACALSPCAAVFFNAVRRRPLSDFARPGRGLVGPRPAWSRPRPAGPAPGYALVEAPRGERLLVLRAHGAAAAAAQEVRVARPRRRREMRGGEGAKEAELRPSSSPGLPPPLARMGVDLAATGIGWGAECPQGAVALSLTRHATNLPRSFRPSLRRPPRRPSHFSRRPRPPPSPPSPPPPRRPSSAALPPGAWPRRPGRSWMARSSTPPGLSGERAIPGGGGGGGGGGAFGLEAAGQGGQGAPWATPAHGAA